MHAVGQMRKMVCLADNSTPTKELLNLNIEKTYRKGFLYEMAAGSIWMGPFVVCGKRMSAFSV